MQHVMRTYLQEFNSNSEERETVARWTQEVRSFIHNCPVQPVNFCIISLPQPIPYG